MKLIDVFFIPKLDYILIIAQMMKKEYSMVFKKYFYSIYDYNYRIGDARLENLFFFNLGDNLMMELIMNKIKFQTYKIDFADIEIKEGRNRVSIFDLFLILL